jgi:hypothetical protein
MERLAQWAGGQQPAIARAAFVKHNDLDIAFQRQVLQAVITHQDVDVGVLRQQGTPAGRPIGANRHR